MSRALLALLLVLPAVAGAAELRLTTWNTESGDADPAVLEAYIAETGGMHLWGLCEVLASWEERFRRAAEEGEGAPFESVLGTTGGADRLLVVYDADRLERVTDFELHDINPGRRVRSPLVVHFRDRSEGVDFLFVVNHLYRSRPELRHDQSSALRDWAAAQSLPVIAVGDYNYDWHFDSGDVDHDRGYDELVAGDVFGWVRPALLVPTHCSRHGSVLDFVFASGSARRWNPTSRILEAHPGYCPDDRFQSDHRPVAATFDLGLGRRQALRQASLERIAGIEADLQRLRALVEEFE